MSLVSTKSLTEIPKSYVMGYSNSAAALNSSRELVACCFMVPKAGDIHTIHFFVGTVTQDNSVKVSIQGINTGGFPNGVVAGSNSVTVHAADGNTWQSCTLASDVTVTHGQYIAVVFELDAWDASDYVEIRTISILAYGSGLHVGHYMVANNAAALTSGTLTAASGYYIRSYVDNDDFTNVGAASNATGVSFVASGTTPAHWEHASALGLYTKSTSSPYSVPIVSLEYSDGTFSQSLGPMGNYNTSISVSTATDPDEVGNYFQVTFPCRAVGVWIVADIDYDTTVTLYDASDTALANCVIYAQNRGQATAGALSGFFDADPASTVTLAKDTWYRLIIAGPATAENIVYCTVPSAAAMDALELGQNCHMTQRTDAGAWSQTTTRRVAVGLIIDQLDNGVSTGGSSPRFGDMTGGLK